MTLEEFKFRVKRASYVRPRNWWSLDGTLEEGLRIAVGDEGVIESDPTLKVRITAIPMVTGAKDDLLTICIAEPAFPPEKLEGALIVGIHRPRT